MLKKIWTTDPVEFQGKYYRIAKSFIGPKPVQKPHPPIYMAAFTPSAMKRVAAEANGWLPVGIPLSGVGAMFDAIKNMAKEAGRDPSALELIVTAGVEIHKTPIEKERTEFTGTHRADRRRFRDSAETRRGGDRHLRAIFAAGGNRRRSYRSNGRALADRKANLSLERQGAADRNEWAFRGKLFIFGA